MDKKQASPETSGKSTPTSIDAPYDDRLAAHVGDPHAAISRATADAQRLLPADVLMLQRSIGNRAVAKLLGRDGTVPVQPILAHTQSGGTSMPNVVQRKLTDGAVVRAEGTEPDVSELSAAALRQLINENLDRVADASVTEAPLSGQFNNGEAGKDNGTKITVDPPAQNLPSSIAAGNANFGLTRHVVANMMLPRDAEHRVGMNLVAEALASRGTGDPRWAGLNFQGKDIFLTLSEDLTVVTTYRKSWDEQQYLAYDRFRDPEKYERLEELERQKRVLVKAATKERDDTAKNTKATLERLVNNAKAENKGFKSIPQNEIPLIKMSGLLQGDDVADQAMVTKELSSILASKEKKLAAKPKNTDSKKKKGKK